MSRKRILWISIDRTKRVAFNIFTPLQQELKKYHDVTVQNKDLGPVPGRFIKKIVANPKSYVKGLDVQYINNNYDMVITDSFFAYIGEEWDKIIIPKVGLIEDQHANAVKVNQPMFDNAKFDYFLVRYKHPFFKRYSHITDDRVLWLPHSVNTKYFHDYEKEKEIGCLSVGQMGRVFYPLRHKFHNELTGKNFYKRVNRPHDSLPVDKKWPIGKDYAKLLNKSWITLNCTASVHYVVNKFFEIPACNSVLCSDFIPELGELGFKPDENMLEVNNKTNMVKFIQKHLRDKENLKRIAQNGYDLVMKNHTTEVRARQLDKWIQGVL